jgi:hypothetical protein
MTSANRADRLGLDLDEPIAASRRCFLAMMAAFIGPSAPSQDGAGDEDDSKSTTRLTAMRRVAKEIKVREVSDSKPGPPLGLLAEPLLHYSAAVWREVDGTLWAWGQRGRPSVLMKLVLRGPRSDQLHWHANVTVVSPKRVEVEFRDGLRWSSRLPGLETRLVPDAPAPADSAAHRLIEAKDIARQISVSARSPAPRGRAQLRLLPRPIHRYSDPAGGLLDGVLFSFVNDSTPDVHLLLEARTERAGRSAWRYLFARQGAGEQIALLHGKQLWSVPAVRPPADTDLYMGRPLPDSAAAE